MSDNPLMNMAQSTISQAKIDNPEPFVYVTKNGEKVTFPDPGAMEMEEAEEFLMGLATKPDTVVLRGWLGEDQYKKFREDRLTIREKNWLLRAVHQHYSDVLGSPGN